MGGSVALTGRTGPSQRVVLQRRGDPAGPASQLPGPVQGAPALIGVGALGSQTPGTPNDGYGNRFTASASGAGQMTLTHPAGPLSMLGDSPSCLTDPNALFEFHVVGNYHADGATQGAFPAPEGPTTGWDEFAWIFRN